MRSWILWCCGLSGRQRRRTEIPQTLAFCGGKRWRPFAALRPNIKFARRFFLFLLCTTGRRLKLWMFCTPGLKAICLCSFQMSATPGGFWHLWKSSVGSTGSTSPDYASLFWPVRMRRREALLTDQETWWAITHRRRRRRRSYPTCLEKPPWFCFFEGGPFPYSVRGGWTLPPGRGTGQSGKSGVVHARGRVTEDRPAAGPPQLASGCSARVRDAPPTSTPGQWKQRQKHVSQPELSSFIEQTRKVSVIQHSWSSPLDQSWNISCLISVLFLSFYLRNNCWPSDMLLWKTPPDTFSEETFQERATNLSFLMF